MGWLDFEQIQKNAMSAKGLLLISKLTAVAAVSFVVDSFTALGFAAHDYITPKRETLKQEYLDYLESEPKND